MDTCLWSLLFAVFTETYIVYQIIIYAPFYISSETHALDSTINLFVALTLSSYPFGLIIGHKPRIYIQNKYGAKNSLLMNFIFNMIGLIIMSDTTIFDRSIYHFIIGSFIMGLFGNSWSNILSISYLLQNNNNNNNNNNNYKNNQLSYCYISASHGIGAIFAGLIGAFLNINNGINIQFIDTPFIISILFCILSIIFIHFGLNINEINDTFDIEDDDNVSLLSSNNNGYKNILFWYNDNNNTSNEASITFYDSISLLIGNRLFFILWMILILLLFVIFSFDILFPTYCSIKSINGGMGWNSHFLGLFYIFYTFSWQFIILYRYYKLNKGYSVTTSFSNSSLKILKFNCLTLILIYGVIFPFCINSASINHSEWTPISWLLLGVILAILLGIISASTSYHIAQSFYDLILNEINNSNDSNDINIDIINTKIHCLFIIISNTLLYIRIFLPMIIQLIWVIGIHLNNMMITKHLHSKREWYQIGNSIFYILSILSLIGFILLIIYDKKRREKYQQQIDRQEMNRLIREIRQQQHQENNINNNVIIEDYHGLGFWISINSKSILSANISHPLCCKIKK